MTKLLSLFLIGLLLNFKYSFDYSLEYEFINYENSKTSTVNYYVNSKNNNYYADFRLSKNEDYNFYFRDENLLTAHADISGNYKNLKEMSLDAKFIRPYKFAFEHKVSKYTVEILTDTLIQNKTFSRISFKPNKIKKSGSFLFIFDKTQNFKPLITHPTALHIWKKNDEPFQGLVVELHSYDKNGKLQWSEKLKNIKPIDFKLEIKN